VPRVLQRKLKGSEVFEKYKDKTFATMTLDERKEFIAAIPWVTRLSEKQQCERGTILKKGRPCRNPGYWKYRYLKKGYHAGATQVVCWSHLWHNGVFYDHSEERRYNDWLTRIGLKGRATIIMPDDTPVEIRIA
jgi:hypothetical protein